MVIDNFLFSKFESNLSYMAQVLMWGISIHENIKV